MSTPDPILSLDANYFVDPAASIDALLSDAVLFQSAAADIVTLVAAEPEILPSPHMESMLSGASYLIRMAKSITDTACMKATAANRGQEVQS